jgi:DNA-binding CsgD family transcriptional regulator
MLTHSEKSAPSTLLVTEVVEPVRRPSRLRRTGLVAAGLLARALPTVFTINITRMLLVWELSEHRFHQLTGQGLVLFALWLGGLVPLVRAGWSGRRPSSLAGWLHVVFMVTGVVCAAAATGGGREAFPRLTSRKMEILDLVARGLENSRIAREPHLSDKTGRNHVSNVLTKLGVAHRSEAIARARAAGLGG